MITSIANWLLKAAGKKPVMKVWSHNLLDVALIIGIVLTLACQATPATRLMVLFLTVYTLIICVTDFGRQIVPDRLTLSGASIALVLAFIVDDLGISESILGGVVGLALLYSVVVAGTWLFKKEAMGGGDIKLTAMLGLFLGWKGVIMSVCIASVLSIIALPFVLMASSEKKIQSLPFGPFSAGSGVIWIVAGSAITNMYLDLLGLV